MNTLDSALWLARQGYAVHWLRPYSKIPGNKGWSTAPVATIDDLRSTYRDGLNLGVRCGHWSQPAPGMGLAVVDADIRDPQYVQAALEALEGFLPDSLEVPIVLSGGGNGSRHLWFTCSIDLLPPKANVTIAAGPEPADKTWKLEVLSTGKQIVCPPSIHPDTGAEYAWMAPLDGPPPLLPDTILQAVEKALEAQAAPVIRTETQRPGPGVDGRPGDDYTQRIDWHAILEPHGWKAVRQSSDITYWCRPGKRQGISATTGYAGTQYLYVFSSNAPPFEPDRAYSPFSAYALLEHAGDFSAAARALSRQGYGSKSARLSITSKRPFKSSRHARRHKPYLFLGDQL